MGDSWHWAGYLYDEENEVPSMKDVPKLVTHAVHMLDKDKPRFDEAESDLTCINIILDKHEAKNGR